MRKSIHIAILALATVGLLLLLLLPHHHHRGMVCMVTSHCATDNADNDRHTGHSDDGSKCFAFGSRVVSVDQSDTHGGALPLYFPLTSVFVVGEVAWITLLYSTLFQPPTNHIPDDFGSRIPGLRAPPMCYVAA